MKKSTPVIILICMILLLSSCGNVNSSQKQAEAETGTEDADNNNESQAEEAAESGQSDAADFSDSNGNLVVKDAVKTSENKMTVEELEEKISEQPVRVVEAEVTSGSDERFGSSYNADMIVPKILNESEKPVKDINVYFVGWDENNLPVVLESNLTQYKADRKSVV